VTTDLGTAAIAGAAAVIGVLCGALLNRRNEKQAEADRLLVSALNDAMIAIAEAAQGGGSEVRARYASAKARIALYASPAVVTVFRRFQDEANTATAEGRALLIDVVFAARHELGKQAANRSDIEKLVLGEEDATREPDN
jgi:hypothetical protein